VPQAGAFSTEHQKYFQNFIKPQKRISVGSPMGGRNKSFQEVPKA